MTNKPGSGGAAIFFFVHVMKTGGATFRRHIEDNHPEPGAVYPDRALDGNLREANILIDRVRTLSPERRSQIRAYTGHFPAVTARLHQRRPRHHHHAP